MLHEGDYYDPYKDKYPRLRRFEFERVMKLFFCHVIPISVREPENVLTTQ